MASDRVHDGDDAHAEAVRMQQEQTQRDASLHGRGLLAAGRAAAAAGDAGAARALLTGAAGVEDAAVAGEAAAALAETEGTAPRLRRRR